MSDWYWRALALKTAFVVTCLFSYIYAQETVGKLPYCNPHNSGDSPVSNDLLIVSTLDGKLTAFSTQNGFKAWDLETQPLLSSNLHHVELSSGGKWVRLVPSLRGTLYSLSGDTIEPLPFDAEQLLSSSFKYSDDLVVAGARETLWIGLDSSSGTVLYECSSSGCSNEQQSATGSRFVLVLRRLANTVRALDPRSGLEKWNFSVAEHQLAISTNRECHIPNKGPVPAATVIVALPDGVVALRDPDSNQLIWKHKLEAPVAGMWRLHGDSLQPIDVLWEGSKSLTESAVLQAPPSIYIGVHEKQLYIQEGSAYGAKLDTAVANKRSPFKLQQSRPLLASDSKPEPNAVSLVTLYGNTGLTENRGFFLYLQDTCDQAVQVSDETVDDSDYLPPNDSTDQSDHHHIHVHVYSLWFWWKEVLLIAVSSALLMNLMIWPRFFAPKFRPATPLPLNKEYIVVERHYERPVVNSVTEYSGRYEKDFTPLRCLGRGGFGVVFEAKNNIDHCSYAVKRITLPKRESKRERVLREVRALAKLEHENIVRYFNAWVEEPPPGWQDQRDAIWMRELDGVSVSMSEDYTASSPLPQIKPPADTTLDLQGGLRALTPPGLDPCLDALDFEKQLTSKRHRSLSCNDSFSIEFDENASKHEEGVKHSSKDLSNVSTKVASADDDSFIVFANSHDASKHSSNVHELSNKHLDVVKRSDDYTKTSETHSRKKKGHRRHWSLDLCVKSAGDGTETGTRIGTKPGCSNMYLYIQMQLCLRDSLHDWLRQNRTAHHRGDKVKGLFSQIVSAVEYVHLAGLIHRDLKPSNIFFAPDGRVKVGDFGLVTTMAESSSSEGCSSDQREAEVHTRHTYRVGTHLYMSPEQLAGRAYSFKVDIYSLGLILLELLQPFNTEAERVATLLRAREQNYPQTFVENYPETAEMLKLMLSADPSLRPTAGGVKSLALQH